MSQKVRTNYSLTETQKELLRSLAFTENLSQSEIVRRALSLVLGSKKLKSDLFKGVKNGK